MQAASIESKLPGFGTTIFTVMTQLANQHKAINLSQGFPDFDGPQLLRDRVSWHMNQGHNQYSPLPGMPALREAIAAKVATLYGAHVDPESQIAVTPGATEALACAIGVTIHAGDEAIDHAMKTGSEKIAALGEQRIERCAVVFQAGALVLDAKAHIAVLPGHIELVEHGNEVGIGPVIENNETGIHRIALTGQFYIDRMGMTTRTTVRLKYRHFMLTGQFPGHHIARDA